MQRIVGPDNSDLKKVSFAIIQNSAPEVSPGSTEREESVLIIMSGHVRVSIKEGPSGELNRKSVFDEPPSAVYLPPYTNYNIEFIDESELALVSCPARGIFRPRFITAGYMRVRRLGEDTYRSNLTEILGEDSSAESLLVGETISDPGNWSSYPPHKHDVNSPNEESALEEFYFFKLSPKNGFGIIRVFDDQEDNLRLIKNNQLVTIPKGYHSVAVIPDHQIYYLWVLAGDNRQVLKSVHTAFAGRTKK